MVKDLKTRPLTWPVSNAPINRDRLQTNERHLQAVMTGPSMGTKVMHCAQFSYDSYINTKRNYTRGDFFPLK